MAIAGCNKSGLAGEDQLMRFSPQLPGTKASETAFESGDEIGVYVTEYKGDIPSMLQLSGNFGNNSRLSLNGSEWTLSPQIWWGEGKYDVYAYYPFDSEINSVDEYCFEVLSDQRGEGFTRSDFMWARKQAVSRMESVPLNFRHKLSRLDIVLTKGEDYEGDIPSDAEVRIYSTNTSALVDLESGDVVKNPYGQVGNIIAHQNATGSYSAIIVPQKLLNAVPLVEILAKDASYLVTSKFIFSEGTRHTMTIELSSNPDKVVINVGGGIEGWN